MWTLVCQDMCKRSCTVLFTCTFDFCSLSIARGGPDVCDHGRRTEKGTVRRPCSVLAAKRCWPIMDMREPTVGAQWPGMQAPRATWSAAAGALHASHSSKRKRKHV